MRWAKCMLILSVACSARVNAQTPDATSSLVAAERAFAADASARTVNDAFHSAFHVDGMLFRPTPTGAHAALSARPIPATLDLKWGPVYAETSADGSLGYTIGYATVGQRGQTPDGTSWFVTIWKKTDGVWKAMTDGGVDAPIPAPLEGQAALLKTRANTKTFATTTDLIAIERHLISEYGPLFAHHSANDVRVYRDGTMPTAGNGSLIDTDPPTEFEPKYWEVAGSGDLGFVYGITNPKSDKPRAYERIYRRNQQGEWEIVVDWRN